MSLDMEATERNATVSEGESLAANRRTRRLLMIAFHYPPANASGTLRALKFSRYLREFDWEVSLLTVPEGCHEVLDPALLAQVPAEVRVHRAFCVDTRRAFSILGRYPAFAAVPDRYVSWLPFAFWRGLQVIRAQGVDAIFSTSPVPTAHLVAYALKRATGLPWVADFRDPWGSGQARGRLRQRVETRMEQAVVRRADRVVGTTEELAEELGRRIGAGPSHKTVAIYNGYDESDFAALRATNGAEPVFCITHAGLLYPAFRHPAVFLRAVRACLDDGRLPADTRVHFLGSGPLARDPAVQRLIAAAGLERVVTITERIAYREALQTMMDSSALLLLQGGQETHAQVPNKAFEYLRSGRPILCLAPARSATARVLRDFTGVFSADPDDADGVTRQLAEVAEAWRRRPAGFDRAAEGVARYSRQGAARALVGLLDGLVAQRGLVGEEQAAATSTARQHRIARS